MSSHGSHRMNSHGSHGLHGSDPCLPCSPWLGDSPLFSQIKGRAVLICGLLALVPAFASAQTPTGHLSIFVGRFPTRDVTELRARVFVEEKADAGSHVRLTAAGFVEGLAADRRGHVTDAVAEPHDLSVDVRARWLDVTAGFTRSVWGRLDELQPTDVINPLDASRFFFEGRSEARLAVPLVRARVYAGGHASLEAVYVPFFRRGRFDRLDEPTSPFDLAPAGIKIHEERPARTLDNAQGGARLNATTGRVDWSAAAYRGFRPFGVYTLPFIDNAAPPAARRLFPRFTMIGGDMETVTGAWGFRAETAVFVEDAFQAPDGLGLREGRSIDSGAGVDRKAGDYRVSGSVLVHHETHDPDSQASSATRTDTSLILSADRTFARERYQGRVFGVYSPSSGSTFVRGIAIAKLQDNLALEGSLGWFQGRGLDTIGRFADSDFIYARLKYYF